MTRHAEHDWNIMFKTHTKVRFVRYCPIVTSNMTSRRPFLWSSVWEMVDTTLRPCHLASHYATQPAATTQPNSNIWNENFHARSQKPHNFATPVPPRTSRLIFSETIQNHVEQLETPSIFKLVPMTAVISKTVPKASGKHEKSEPK